MVMRSVIVSISLVVLACGAFVPAQSSSKDKSASSSSTRNAKIGGKTLEQWLEDAKSADRSRAETALKAIQSWPGPDIVDAGGLKILLDELGRHKANIGDVSMRVNLAMAVGHTLAGGLQAKDDKGKPFHAKLTSKEIKSGVDKLTALLSDAQYIVRYRAIEALGKIGPDAHTKESVKEVIAQLKNQYTFAVRQAAAMALGTMGMDPKTGPSKEVLDALCDAITEPTKAAKIGEASARVRLAAVQALTMYGPGLAKNKKVMDKLEHAATRDSDASVQIWAQVGIMHIEKDYPNARLAAIGMLLKNHTEQAVRIQAAQALGSLADKAKGEIPTLIGCMGDQDPMIIYWSILAVGTMKESGKVAEEPLKAIKGNMKLPEQVRDAAERALEVIAEASETKKKS
jgi:HEAT repeat protein